MRKRAQSIPAITRSEARRIWLHAQRLDEAEPFGDGHEATVAAVQHLGYVQIDTINVIERAHHHVLWTRIPTYRRGDLHRAQTVDKAVFEYWTHALSYVPTRDLRFFLPEMKRHRESPSRWFSSVSKTELRRVLTRIRDDGPISIRDIEDDVLVDKNHPWASRKPSKRALQMGFYNGLLTISERAGMLKTYDLMDRHFGWETRPRAASERQIVDYLLVRALRAQGVVSPESVCYLDARRKPAVRGVIEERVKRQRLQPVRVAGAERTEHWAYPNALEPTRRPDLVHILSPFDPLVIQRKRLKAFFEYEHRFEAYVPREMRVLGYFALPVRCGDQIAAAIDLKADREKKELLIQKWTWVGGGSAPSHGARIEETLHRFQQFQFES